MPTTIRDIRYKVEQAVKDALENLDVLAWCNDAQLEIMNNIELPLTAQIAVNTNAVTYTEPSNLKRINRLWLQSDRDQGRDVGLGRPYRRYMGQIIFESPFPQPDTLNVDFYGNLKHFAAMTDTIDLPDRFLPLYTAYCQAQYYLLPKVIEKLSPQIATRQNEAHYNRHLMIKEQVTLFYLEQTQPSAIKEVPYW